MRLCAKSCSRVWGKARRGGAGRVAGGWVGAWDAGGGSLPRQPCAACWASYPTTPALAVPPVADHLATYQQLQGGHLGRQPLKRPRQWQGSGSGRRGLGKGKQGEGEEGHMLLLLTLLAERVGQG